MSGTDEALNYAITFLRRPDPGVRSTAVEVRSGSAPIVTTHGGRPDGMPADAVIRTGKTYVCARWTRNDVAFEAYLVADEE